MKSWKGTHCINIKKNCLEAYQKRMYPKTDILLKSHSLTLFMHIQCLWYQNAAVKGFKTSLTIQNILKNVIYAVSIVIKLGYLNRKPTHSKRFKFIVNKVFVVLLKRYSFCFQYETLQFFPNNYKDMWNSYYISKSCLL